ncbi:MAG: hypothetical protein U1D30_05015 [Planctomycetota bacterium]
MSRVWPMAAILVVLVPTVTQAQIGFSRRQQAGMLAYQAQIRAKEQVRQQATLQQIQRQFVQQQSEINRQQFRSNSLIDFLESTDPETQQPPGRHRGHNLKRTCTTSPYFNRINPYYDRAFIQTRNRQFIITFIPCRVACSILKSFSGWLFAAICALLPRYRCSKFDVVFSSLNSCVR